MAVKLHNPYKNKKGQWIRGNFHGHCSENSGCSSVPLAEGVRSYRDIGTQFMAVTDHDCVTDLEMMKKRYKDMVFLHGFEYSSRENLAFIGEEVGSLYELSLEEALLQAEDLFTMVCHPRPYAGEREYWTRDKLAALGTWPDGIEIYNGHYSIEQARKIGRWPLYTDFWDELLSEGHRLWGFANDDFHDPEDLGNAFNMLLVEEMTPAAILQAARSGCSYGSTGLLLQEVSENEGHIAVEVEASCTGTFIGPGGEELAGGEGTHFEFVAGDEAYVRFQGEGEMGYLFLQPMFREST